MLNQLLNKLERKFGRFAIPHLMSVILVGMIVIFCGDLLMQANPNISEELRMQGAVSSLFEFNLAQIKAGQVWRLVTFIFLPPDTGILFAVFVFYFTWLIGISLETTWGSFKFNIFVLLGMIGTIIAGCISGSATNIYLDFSMFIAFAILNPNFEVLLFFFIPIKVKWLALLDALGLLIVLLFGTWGMKFMIIAALLNLIVFFGKDLVTAPYYAIRRQYYKHKRNQK